MKFPLTKSAVKKPKIRDPYYEKVRRATGKLVKEKRAFPPGLSDHDLEILKSVREMAHRLDWSLFNMSGRSFGWSSVIGIIPVMGDAINGLMSLSVFRKCCKVDGGLPPSVKLQMGVNIVVGFVIGMVPGAAIVYRGRGNTQIAWLLEKHFTNEAEKEVQ